MSKRDPIYKVIFLNQGQVYEMYAKQIFQSDLWGFLEVEEFVFGERSQLVVDPSEEKLKAQFEGVVRSFVPMHSIVRIDEVERMGTPKISEAKGVSNIMPFPMPMPERSRWSRARREPIPTSTYCCPWARCHGRGIRAVGRCIR